ncbi:MAG TPA: sugar transferase, partial [Candidatus Binataceae bacterium]
MFAGELRKQKALFAISDAIALIGAFAAALALHDPDGAMQARLFGAGSAVIVSGAAALAVLWILVFRACDLYQIRNGGLREAFTLVKACSLAAALTLLTGFLIHWEVSRLTVGIALLFSGPAVILARGIMRALMRQFYASPGISIPLVVIGFNPVSQYLCDKIREELTQYEALGFIDEGADGRQYHGLPVLGSIERLGLLAKFYPGLEAAIALPDASSEVQEKIIQTCERYRVRWRMVPWLFRSMATGIKVDTLGIIPLIGPRGSNIEGLNFLIKRSFDIAGASMLLIFASPFLALAYLAILIFEGRPVFFRQKRAGIHGKPFEMIKFRTMINSAADTAHREYVQRWISEQQAVSL